MHGILLLISPLPFSFLRDSYARAGHPTLVADFRAECSVHRCLTLSFTRCEEAVDLKMLVLLGLFVALNLTDNTDSLGQLYGFVLPSYV